MNKINENVNLLSYDDINDFVILITKEKLLYDYLLLNRVRSRISATNLKLYFNAAINLMKRRHPNKTKNTKDSLEAAYHSFKCYKEYSPETEEEAIALEKHWAHKKTVIGNNFTMYKNPKIFKIPMGGQHRKK